MALYKMLGFSCPTDSAFRMLTSSILQVTPRQRGAQLYDLDDGLLRS